MASISCNNCGTCTCTGTYIVNATNGMSCCSACVATVNAQLAEGQILYPKTK